MTPDRRLLVIAGIVGALGIAAGAFGAHALRPTVWASDLDVWRTAAHYHQLHAVVLLVVACLDRTSPLVRAAGWLFLLGIAVFSGTLYVMVLGGPRWLGAVTPLGGACLIGAWALLAVSALSRPRPGRG